MKRIIILSLAACLIAVATSCGGTKSTDLPNPPQNLSSETAQQKIDNSGGYISAMSALAGLDMEVASIDDVISKFGQPSDTQTELRSGVKCTILSYSFGTLYFEDRNNIQTLTFALITDKLPEGIYGVNIGDDIYSAAEAFYGGSSKKVKEIMQLAETARENQTLFYGSLQDGKYIPPYGFFKLIDIEQSADDSMYTLEYAVASSSETHMHKIDFIFGRDMKLTRIMIDCSEIF